MRLLHIDQDGNLLLTDFRGDDIPPYAILSHRWGESEVLFEDVGLGNRTYLDKVGCGKLEFFVHRAIKDDLHYWWIDTCCINKWNLQELSTAINSMFDWYRNATRCYVFLSDVSVSAATETPERSDWEASFRESVWFTRGWTLQELIAPSSVEFFSREGRFIGDKKTLEQLVHEITNIPLAALRSCSLDKFTMPERIQWAQGRETTEEEDNVYCLLGILNVSMPTSYGEGKTKALKRLQAEVDTASSLPAIIPFPQNDRFVGRESQLAELEAKLFGDKKTTTMAIVGPGGTGKSQLALELAYRTRKRHKNCSVFWIDAGDIASLYQSLESIAKKLEVPGWDDEKADMKQLVKFYLREQSQRQCLLIFDNTEDRNLGPSGLSTAADLIDYIPHSKLCSVVVTTTNSDIPKRLGIQNVVEVWEMTPDTAQRMLENYLDAPVSRSEQEQAKLLLQELSYLPLAIVQAAAYINTRRMMLQEFRSQLRKKQAQALEHGHKGFKDNLQGNRTKNPVATTLFTSMDQIRLENTLAADYLLLAACVDWKDIPLDLLEASSPREREAAMKILSSYALVTRRPAESAFELHRLVHGALREWLGAQGLLHQWTQHAISRLISMFPGHDHRSRSKWRRLLPHAKHVLSPGLTELESEQRLDLARGCATALYSDGRFGEAEELDVQIVEASKKVFGDEHLQTLASMSDLATTYFNQGRYKEAEELYARLLEAFKRVLGDEHSGTLTGMAHLAMTYKNQDRWKEAEELQVQTVEASKRVLGDEHPDTQTRISTLASIYEHQGRWNEAEKLQVKELEISSRALGHDHPDTITGRANLALTYWGQGKHEAAEKLEEQVLEAKKRVLGKEHPNTLTATSNLALTFMARGRGAEAISLMETCVQLRMRTLGSHHPETKASVDTLNEWQMAKKENKDMGPDIIVNVHAPEDGTKN